jgi:hypothetical protein
LNDSIDLLKKDAKFYVAELRILEEQNNQLIRENVRIKIFIKITLGKFENSSNEIR